MSSFNDTMPSPRTAAASFVDADFRAAGTINSLTDKIASEARAVHALEGKEHVVSNEINALLREQGEIASVGQVAVQLHDQAGSEEFISRMEQAVDDSEAAKAICNANLRRLAGEDRYLLDLEAHEETKLHQLRQAKHDLAAESDIDLIGFNGSVVERELEEGRD